MGIFTDEDYANPARFWNIVNPDCTQTQEDPCEDQTANGFTTAASRNSAGMLSLRCQEEIEQ
eukprot:4093409-Amphidinium_carterae.2